MHLEVTYTNVYFECRVEKLGHSVPKFDFRVPGVTSITADIHKYGFGAKVNSHLTTKFDNCQVKMRPMAIFAHFKFFMTLSSIKTSGHIIVRIFLIIILPVKLSQILQIQNQKHRIGNSILAVNLLSL